jgi:hypothetical protein
VSKSDYAENKINELLVGKTAFATPTAHVALYTAAPSDAGGGTEVSGGSYARKATTGSDWAASSGGSIANAAALTFPTASGSWGTVTHFGVLDASSSGNLLFWGALTASKVVGSGDSFSFAIGTLVHTED